MARQENPFDMQIKLLMIGDSGACRVCVVCVRAAHPLGDGSTLERLSLPFRTCPHPRHTTPNKCTPP